MEDPTAIRSVENGMKDKPSWKAEVKVLTRVANQDIGNPVDRRSGKFTVKTPIQA